MSIELKVVGSAEHQAELTALLAAGDADYGIGSEFCLTVAIGLVERRLRQRLLRITREAAARKSMPARQARNKRYGTLAKFTARME